MNQAPDEHAGLPATTRTALDPIDAKLLGSLVAADAALDSEEDIAAAAAAERRRRRILLAVCVGVAVVFIGLSVPFLLRGDDEPALGGGVGTVISPPQAVEDFTLQQAGDGAPLSISALQGRPTLLFFGYTHCPDVCPTTLGEFRDVRTQMGADAERINFLFISVDGSRDTPQSLRSYLDVFDTAFIGMTGPEDVVRAAGRQFDVTFAVSTTGRSAAGYFVDHTTSSYLLDAEGDYIVNYPFGVDPTLIVNDIREVLDAQQATGSP